MRACLIPALIAVSIVGVQFFNFSQTNVWLRQSSGVGVVEVFLDAEGIGACKDLNARSDGTLRASVWYENRLEHHRFWAANLQRTTIEITSIFADPFEKGPSFAKDDPLSRSIKLGLKDLKDSQQNHVRNQINAGLRSIGDPLVPDLLINHQPQYSAAPQPWALVPWGALFIFTSIGAAIWFTAEAALARFVAQMRQVRNKCINCGYQLTDGAQMCSECGSAD